MNQLLSKKYSILTFNFNHYEQFYKSDEYDPECEYVYVTDDDTIVKQAADTPWKVILWKTDIPAFNKVFQVRYHPFKFCTTNTAIVLDGSVIIKKSLKKLVDDFLASNADLAVNVHPKRWHLPTEYSVWINYRNYPVDMANKHLNLMSLLGYDFNYKGQIQATIRICKNTSINTQIDDMTYNLIQMFNTNDYIERLDQTLYSFVVQHYFKNIKVFPMHQQVIQNDYMVWTLHDPTKIVCSEPERDQYLFNELQKLYYLR